MTKKSDIDKKVRMAFASQKCHAKLRNIDFALSFEEWWDIWNKSNKWDMRGRKKGQYCMCRNGDAGPYSKLNVQIKTNDENIKEAHKGVSESFQMRQRLSASMTGIKKSPESIAKRTITRKLNRIARGHNGFI